MIVRPDALSEPTVQLIQAELVRLATAIPAILAASLIYIDGVSVAYYGRRDPSDEVIIAGITPLFVSLGERVAAELGTDNDYVLLGGPRGTGIYFPVGEDYLLVLIVEPNVSFDSLIPVIKPSCETLQKIVAP